MKILAGAAAFLLAAGAAWAQDKGKPGKDRSPDQLRQAGVLKEVEKLLDKQRDEILAAVRRMLDERLGKASAEKRKRVEAPQASKKRFAKPGKGTPSKQKKKKKTPRK
jgi:hypothetical protein